MPREDTPIVSAQAAGVQVSSVIIRQGESNRSSMSRRGRRAGNEREFAIEPV